MSVTITPFEQKITSGTLRVVPDDAFEWASVFFDDSHCGKFKIKRALQYDRECKRLLALAQWGALRRIDQPTTSDVLLLIASKRYRDRLYTLSMYAANKQKAQA